MKLMESTLWDWMNLCGRMHAVLHWIAWHPKSFTWKAHDLWLKCWLCVWFDSVENEFTQANSHEAAMYSGEVHNILEQFTQVIWIYFQYRTNILGTLHFVSTLYVNIDRKTPFSNKLIAFRVFFKMLSSVEESDTKFVNWNWFGVWFGTRIIDQKTNLLMLLRLFVCFFLSNLLIFSQHSAIFAKHFDLVQLIND